MNDWHSFQIRIYVSSLIMIIDGFSKYSYLCRIALLYFVAIKFPFILYT